MLPDKLTIFINDKPFSIPTSESKNVCDLAYMGGLDGAKPTYRRDGSVVTDRPDWCIVECDERGEWNEPVWTVNKHCLRPIPLLDGMRFASFPDGAY